MVVVILVYPGGRSSMLIISHSATDVRRIFSSCESRQFFKVVHKHFGEIFNIFEKALEYSKKNCSIKNREICIMLKKVD